MSCLVVWPRDQISPIFFDDGLNDKTSLLLGVELKSKILLEPKTKELFFVDGDSEWMEMVWEGQLNIVRAYSQNPINNINK